MLNYFLLLCFPNNSFKVDNYCGQSGGNFFIFKWFIKILCTRSIEIATVSSVSRTFTLRSVFIISWTFSISFEVVWTHRTLFIKNAFTATFDFNWPIFWDCTEVLTDFIILLLLVLVISFCRCQPTQRLHSEL